MKLLRYGITACALLAPGLTFAGEIELRDLLRRDYAEQAIVLRFRTQAALKNEDICREIVAPLSKANRIMEQAQDAMCKACKVKNHKPTSVTDEWEMRIIQFTEIPPFLREDPNDLYNRYRSAILLSLFSYDKDGNQICANDHPYDVTIPVAADLEGKWHFPTMREVIEFVKLRIIETAKGRLEMAEQDSRMAADCKRLRVKR